MMLALERWQQAELWCSMVGQSNLISKCLVMKRCCNEKTKKKKIKDLRLTSDHHTYTCPSKHIYRHCTQRNMYAYIY